MNVARFCEDDPRMPANARLGTVVFPNGSVAVLPADSALQVAVAREAIALSRGTSWSRKAAA